jgi:hypothetical protein
MSSGLASSWSFVWVDVRPEQPAAFAMSADEPVATLE